MNDKFCRFAIFSLIINLICYSYGFSAITEGQAVYNKHCSVCHGDQGDGSSWARNGLNPPPRNFTAVISKRELSRRRMLHSVTEGRPGTAMMPFKTRLSGREISSVVSYIRAKIMGLQEEADQAGPASPAPEQAGKQPTEPVSGQAPLFPGGLHGDAVLGQQFYERNCYVCHGLKGDGRGPRSRFISPPPRNFLSSRSRRLYDRRALFEAISTGKRGTVMPAWATVLQPQQIANVAEYVYSRFIQVKKKPARGVTQP